MLPARLVLPARPAQLAPWAMLGRREGPALRVPRGEGRYGHDRPSGVTQTAAALDTFGNVVTPLSPANPGFTLVNYINVLNISTLVLTQTSTLIITGQMGLDAADFENVACVPFVSPAPQRSAVRLALPLSLGRGQS